MKVRDVISAEGFGQEAISYQGRSMFFEELITEFDALIRSDSKTNRKETASTIEKLTKKHTGITIKMDYFSGVNAYAVPLVANENHPFLQRFRSYGRSEIIGDLGVLEAQKRLLATTATEVDLKKGFIKGAFSEITFEVCMGYGLWAQAKLTADEVAAIFLHELGHIFTFIERTINAVTANMAIHSVIEALGRTEGRTEKFKIVEEFNTVTKSKVDPNDVIDQKSAKGVQTILVREWAKGQLPSSTGLTSYEMTGSEFVADQFAARHGAGLSIARGLDRMYQNFGADSYRRSKTAHWIIQLVAILVAIFSVALTSGLSLLLGIIFLIFDDYETRDYDAPADRYNRIKRDMIQSIKNPHLPSRHRQLLLEDIAAMDKLFKGAVDREGWFEILWASLTSKRRKMKKDRIFQQELERLTNNELFVRSAQLKQLA